MDAIMWLIYFLDQVLVCPQEGQRGLFWQVYPWILWSELKGLTERYV